MMSNPLYNALNGNQFGPVQLSQEFQKFVQEMKGRDPNQEISKLLQSGKISQQQLDQAQQMAQQFRGILRGIK